MRKKVIFILICIFALAVIVISPFIGSTRIPLSSLRDINLTSVESQIFYSLRLPRVLTAFLAGAALSCCGVALQAMFRNPLATPFTLGISSGAAFGAAMYVIFAASLRIPFAGIIFSFIGSLAAVLLVYGFTKVKKGFSVGTMLLAGVAVNFFFSSLILFLQYVSDFTQSFRVIRWLMGSIDVSGFQTPLVFLLFTAAGIAIIALQSLNLNLMSISDEIAISRGVNLSRSRKIIFFATSIMVAVVVAYCGPIGFVGLMAPHICRLLVGFDNKILTAASVLFGGAFLALCDTFARTLIAPAEIPVGVITSMLGGPFFVWLLLRSSRSNNL
ncbi:MAG: Hemin transport system permease protein HmuU [Planctomycetes bacterium ADurb.Bin401]|nr:MAG: Hemin transport system permease protein HmuU [Planctomycetes bacterium ADurb.Bin401]